MRRGMLARNELALYLKGIGLAYSRTVTKDAGAAEDWAARVLDTVGIGCPERLTNPAAFRAMFSIID